MHNADVTDGRVSESESTRLTVYQTVNNFHTKCFDV